MAAAGLAARILRTKRQGGTIEMIWLGHGSCNVELNIAEIRGMIKWSGWFGFDGESSAHAVSMDSESSRAFSLHPAHGSFAKQEFRGRVVGHEQHAV